VIHITNQSNSRKALHEQRFVRYTSDMQFKVPQFIDVEDKVFGSLTFKQFAYLAGGGGLAYLSFKIFPAFIAVLLALFFIALSLALTFFKYNDKPFAFTLQAMIRYITHPRLYLWHKDYSKKKEKVVEIPQQSSNAPGLTESKLKTLSWSLDVIDPNKQ
jgi:hypothetical protein